MATYHEGEIEVQTRAGVRAMAEQVGHSIRNLISPSAAAFAPLQRLAIVGSVASDGGVWASAVAGEPGYLSVPDLHSLQVATPRTDDPLWTNLQQNPAIGVLILDPVMRRLRINGPAELTDQGFLLRVEQAYTNCAQYIQQRAPEITAMDPGERRQMHSRLLLPRQQAWIVGADTFFLATAHPAIGTDASH
ncbi:MAG TPA: pyridoxamine 5'-phosphate oxidase family protein, partial [Terriglobales bacterium]